MISKTSIDRRAKRKINPELVEAIYLAKKQNQLELAKVLSGPTRAQAKINVEDINKSEKESVIIPGKVLGTGSIDRKSKVYAIGFSATAKEKLEKAGCECKTLLSALREGKISGEILK